MSNEVEIHKEVLIDAGTARLEGELHVPAGASGVVLFAHGSGSSRHSPRNGFVARVIRESGVGTLLFDLLTAEEEAVDIYTREFRFNIGLLTTRLTAAAEWVMAQADTRELKIGFFGASTGGAAALAAAAELGDKASAVVSRGGRPDLAGDALPLVTAPVLLIVGGYDGPVIELNEQAFDELECKKELKIVPGATHLFEEPGTLEQVADLTAEWFAKYLSTDIGPIGMNKEVQYAGNQK